MGLILAFNICCLHVVSCVLERHYPSWGCQQDQHTGRKTCSVTELRHPGDRGRGVRTPNWNLSLTRASVLYNMSWHSYKVHLVPSSSARGVPGDASTYHLCQSSCSLLTAAASPASAVEEDTVWLTACIVFSGAFSFLFFHIPWQNIGDYLQYHGNKQQQTSTLSGKVPTKPSTHFQNSWINISTKKMKVICFRVA